MVCINATPLWSVARNYVSVLGGEAKMHQKEAGILGRAYEALR